VASFAPSANLRRVLKRGSKLRVEIGKPIVDDLRLALYHRWHADREKARGWRADEIRPDSYEMQFCFPHPASREFTYWLGDKLVGVGIADETPGALSAVYCFHEPELSHLSIGTFNVLSHLAHARLHGLAHVYLGFRVEACESLRYKGRFTPQERLAGRVEDGAAPRWEPLG
jgi:leucyl-tRNA---protein transferase